MLRRVHSACGLHTVPGTLFSAEHCHSLCRCDGIEEQLFEISSMWALRMPCTVHEMLTLLVLHLLETS